MKMRDDPGPDYKSSATLMDAGGQALAKVQVNLSPAGHSGNFQLPSPADAEKVMTATSLQTLNGKRFQLTDLKYYPGYNSIADQPRFEFHFETA